MSWSQAGGNPNDLSRKSNVEPNSSSHLEEPRFESQCCRLVARNCVGTGAILFSLCYLCVLEETL